MTLCPAADAVLVRRLFLVRLTNGRILFDARTPEEMGCPVEGVTAYTLDWLRFPSGSLVVTASGAVTVGESPPLAIAIATTVSVPWTQAALKHLVVKGLVPDLARLLCWVFTSMNIPEINHTRGFSPLLEA